MVTKHNLITQQKLTCLILAKNHMVTKLTFGAVILFFRLILAKNHMVTKLYS